MIIAVDFDGTLCSPCWPYIGKPNTKLINYLKEEKKNGHQLILWTCRNGKLLEEAVIWCKQQGLEFDAVNENLPWRIQSAGYDPRKILADVFIDDRNSWYPTNDISDGYHTFGELYEHRAKLFAVICNSHKTKSWKSKLHHDGTMYPGMFIVGINTPTGQATYHYRLEQWELFRVKELKKAPEWDGHTPKEAIDRILSIKPE